eukprot:gb/GFBE01008269.1/.p1 GENE.gb/GFBE01008269.1/~~gb/GFBE01008269.1/.p1  ORF type:complete len:627 (+),score=91.58 gb/GFBE01008269.1/:1-1881(+)
MQARIFAGIFLCLVFLGWFAMMAQWQQASLMTAAGDAASIRSDLDILNERLKVVNASFFHVKETLERQTADLQRTELVVHQEMPILRQLVRTLEQYDRDISTKINLLERHAGHHEQCSATFQPGNFASSEALTAAGWIVNFASMKYGEELEAFTNGPNYGEMLLEFKRAGRLTIRIQNLHAVKDEPANIAHVSLVEDMERPQAVIFHGKVFASQTSLFCINVDMGNVLRISEEYAIIVVKHIEFQCREERGLGVQKEGMQMPANLSAGACSVGQRVSSQQLESQGACNSIEREIETVVNTTHAFISESRPLRTKDRFDTKRFVKDKWRLVSVSTAPLFTETGKCDQFHVQDSGVGILVAADVQFQASYAVHIQSMRCYARDHGYDLWLLAQADYPECNIYGNFFFVKHCLVAKFLAKQRPNYTAVVIDADTVAVNVGKYKRSLDYWLSPNADLSFYVRDGGGEIAAGNYIARNTPLARDFLLAWAEFARNGRAGPGYSSADNGAIHILLVETLGFTGAEQCAKMYSSLRASVLDLKPYFNYTACTLKLFPSLDVSSAYPVPSRTSGSIMVRKLNDFFVVDGVQAAFKTKLSTGPVFHHGVKQPAIAMSSYYADLATCTPSKDSVLP